VSTLLGLQNGAGWDRSRRLLRRADFVRLSATGVRAETRTLVALSAPAAAPRVGITVSRKVGGAVVRNRVRRWIREAVRVRWARMPSVDVVLVARRAAAGCGLVAIGVDVDRVIDRLWTA
jgi:ribonuclease P protein component